MQTADLQKASYVETVAIAAYESDVRALNVRTSGVGGFAPLLAWASITPRDRNYWRSIAWRLILETTMAIHSGEVSAVDQER